MVGQSVPRTDAALQVTGKSQYGGDVHIPGMLYCKIKFSDKAHAKIKRLDVSKAEALPGVHAVITAKDVPYNVFGMFIKDQQMFRTDSVMQFSDYLAAVAAESVEIAEQAVSLIEVDYEDLPIVTDPEAAMHDDAYNIHGGDTNIAFYRHIETGNVEEGFADADLIVKQDLSTPGIEQAPLEPHAAVAYVEDTSGDLIIRSSMQKPFELAGDVAKAIDWPISKVRVIASAIGGGFGGKNEPTMEPAIALLAIKTGRPIKCEYTREEEFMASSVRHAYRIHYMTGLKRDGTIIARQVRIVSDSGPYVLWGASTLSKASIHSCGPYDIPNMKVDGYLVYTNNPVGGAMRGFGVTQLGFAYEAHTDFCAKELGMDPIAFRRKNLIKDGSKLPTEMKMNIVTVGECLDKAIALAEKGGDW